MKDFMWFAGAGAGLPVRGCGVCLNAGLPKYSLVNAGVVLELDLTLVLTLTLAGCKN